MSTATFNPSLSLNASCKRNHQAVKARATPLRKTLSPRQPVNKLQVRATAAASDSSTSSSPTKSVTTVEEQRAMAKQLVKYFEDKQYEERVEASRTFGWTKEAELANGRWVMFGLLVGMMTEYATGVDFVDQIRITITNLGFADVYE
eukprot:CAMPEP_0197847208 /NCGR_PEP_ID=MMETSP1438-20131217/5523_1 /TAXON_ID=1461541 /ORGANISM="Pterosperma sp., Strain CCMP1384" /LENGTH=146 /DNA_ID=CAMNT_0043459069 /DNA_START=108 /DNA_END=548 /DNA_ORIENTATION=+